MIVNDLSLLCEEKDIRLSGELIRAIIVLSQMNAHIWYNEAKARKGESQDLALLKLTHGLNGIRVDASNYLLELIGERERSDVKTDCLAAEFKDWNVSLRDEENNTNKT